MKKNYEMPTIKVVEMSNFMSESVIVTSMPETPATDEPAPLF